MPCMPPASPPIFEWSHTDDNSLDRGYRSPAGFAEPGRGRRGHRRSIRATTSRSALPGAALQGAPSIRRWLWLSSLFRQWPWDFGRLHTRVATDNDVHCDRRRAGSPALHDPRSPPTPAPAPAPPPPPPPLVAVALDPAELEELRSSLAELQRWRKEALLVSGRAARAVNRCGAPWVAFCGNAGRHVAPSPLSRQSF